MINWIYLFLAGICEIGWPIGLKLAIYNRWWAVFAILTMAASGFLLFLAQKTIPMGTAIYSKPNEATDKSITAPFFCLKCKANKIKKLLKNIIGGRDRSTVNWAAVKNDKITIAVKVIKVDGVISPPFALKN